MTRPIENSDIWAAVRGLGMFGMLREELEQLIAQHQDSDLFASQVIAEAARQVRATKRASDDR